MRYLSTPPMKQATPVRQQASSVSDESGVDSLEDLPFGIVPKHSSIVRWRLDRMSRECPASPKETLSLT